MRIPKKNAPMTRPTHAVTGRGFPSGALVGDGVGVIGAVMYEDVPTGTRQILMFGSEPVNAIVR
jgi:hypothetical protein